MQPPGGRLLSSGQPIELPRETRSVSIISLGARFQSRQTAIVLSRETANVDRGTVSDWQRPQ